MDSNNQIEPCLSRKSSEGKPQIFTTLRNIDLNLLTIFEAVYVHKGIVNAAKVLNLTPSAISQSIQKLRVIFPDPLFIRKGQGVTPTAFAMHLHEYITQGLESIIGEVNIEEKYDKKTMDSAVQYFWEDMMKDLKADNIGGREKFINTYSKDVPIYLLCYSGQKSEELEDTLEDMGYEAYSIDGGFVAYLKWKFTKYIEEDKDESSEDAADRVKEIERSIVKKFRKPIWRKFTQTLNEYDLIQDGDKIAVCISGGKDSMLMAKLFQELKKHGKNNFDLVFLVMNPGYNDLNYNVILNNAKLLDIPITVFKTEIFDTVVDITESPCYMCARMRRGYLYNNAKELGCNKIALGHHYDDVIETILMGMLYGAQIQTMMPKLHSTNFEGMELIRPMYLIR